MLPRTDGIGVADGNGLPHVQCPHGIGDNAIFGPVPSPDHIAGTGAGHLDVMILEKGIPVCGCSDLSHRLAGTVGIMPAERICLLVGPPRFMVLINLVGGDDHNGGGMREST